MGARTPAVVRGMSCYWGPSCCMWDELLWGLVLLLLWGLVFSWGFRLVWAAEPGVGGLSLV